MKTRLTIATAGLLLTGAAPAPTQHSCDPNEVAAQAHSLENQLSGAACLMEQRGMSPTGISKVIAGMRSEQAEQLRIFQQESQQLTSMSKAANAEPFDSAAFEKALRALKATRSSAFSTSIDAEIQTLRSLSPTDQRLFARLLHGGEGNVRLGMPARPLQDH